MAKNLDPKDAKQVRTEITAAEVAARDLGRDLGYVLSNLKESAKVLDKQAGIFNNVVKSSQELNELAKDNVQVAKDVTVLYDREVQITSDLLLKKNMISSGLKGDYAQLVTTYMLENDIADVNDQKVQLLVKELKHRQHVSDEMAKQVEIDESLANWQLQLTEELEEYGKSWEKLKSKIRAVVTDKEVLKSFLTAKGLDTLKDKFLEVGEIFSEFRKEGLTMTQAFHETEIALGAAFSVSAVGMKDAAEIQGAMAKEMGNMNHLSSETVENAGTLAKTFGLSNEAAGKLTAQFQMMPGATAESANETLKFAGNLAKASGVAPGAVMESIANSAEEVASFSKDGGKNIATAAVAAKKLGVEFGTLTKMADNLLDFESSIEKQMEASVLLGREINLDKARELALNGDLLGATQEMLTNIGGEAEFNKMNVVQRKALADSMGVSVAELSKMVKNQDQLNNLTQEQQEALANGEMSMDEALATTGGMVDKFKDGLLAAGGLFGSVKMIKSGLTDAVGIGKQFGDSLKEGKGFMGSIVDGIRNFVGLAPKGAKQLAAVGAGGAEKLAEGGEKLAETAGGAADKTKKVSEAADKAPKAKAGQGVKDFLTNLAEGLKAMGTGKVLAGAFNLIPASLGLVAMIPGLLGAKLLEFIKGEKIQSNLYGLAYGLEAFGNSKVTVGALNLVAASIGLTAMILGVVGAKLIELINGEKVAASLSGLADGLVSMQKTFLGSLALGAFAVAAILAIRSLIFLGGIALLGKPAEIGLKALGSGLAALGNPATAVFALIGIGLLAALGLAMIPLTYALSLLTPLVEAFGNIIVNALGAVPPIVEAVGNAITSVLGAIPPIIDAVAAGFERMMTVLADNWQILIPVGLGLGAVAYGIGAMGVAALLAAPGLAILAFTLPSVGAALKDVGTGAAQLASSLSTVLPNIQLLAAAATDEIEEKFVGIGEGIAQLAQYALLAAPTFILASAAFTMFGAATEIAASGMQTLALAASLAVPLILEVTPAVQLLSSLASPLLQTAVSLLSVAAGLLNVGVTGASILPILFGLVAAGFSLTLAYASAGTTMNLFANASANALSQVTPLNAQIAILVSFAGPLYALSAALVDASFSLNYFALSALLTVPPVMGLSFALGILGINGMFATTAMMALYGAHLLVLSTLDPIVAGFSALNSIIPSLLPGLFSLAAAMFSVSAGLSSVGFSGVLAIPVIGALVGLAAVSPLLVELANAFNLGEGGGGGATESSTSDEKLDILIGKIDELISVASKGGVINMDGRKVGELVRASINSSNIR